MNRNNTRSIKTILPVIAASLLPLIASAGDGPYIGLEGGVSFLPHQNFDIYNFDPRIGTVPDGTRAARIGFGTGYAGGLTLGYALTSGPRFELELAHRHNKFDSVTFADGTPSERTRGKQNADIVFGNAWYDLFKSGWFHPYLGGGIGVARVDIRNPGFDTVNGPLGGTLFDGNALESDFDTVFAYQGGGGLRFDIGRHLSASFDYRYLATAKRENYDLLSNNPNSHVESRYQSHAALFSIHYYFSAPPKAAAPEPAPEPVAVVPVAEEPTPPAEAPPPPAAPPCQPPEPGQPINLDGCKAGDVIVLRGVNFDFNKSTLTVNAKTLLDDVAQALTKRSDIKIAIQGHTDSKGSDSYNQKLSERRAASVKKYLESHGIAADRIVSMGFGESMPVADNATDEGRELNRRVELKITEGGEGATVAPAADAPAEAAPAADAPAADAAAPAPADATAPAADAPPATADAPATP